MFDILTTRGQFDSEPTVAWSQISSESWGESVDKRGQEGLESSIRSAALRSVWKVFARCEQ